MRYRALLVCLVVLFLMAGSGNVYTQTRQVRITDEERLAAMNEHLRNVKEAKKYYEMLINNRDLVLINFEVAGGPPGCVTTRDLEAAISSHYVLDRNGQERVRQTMIRILNLSNIIKAELRTKEIPALEKRIAQVSADITALKSSMQSRRNPPEKEGRYSDSSLRQSKWWYFSPCLMELTWSGNEVTGNVYATRNDRRPWAKIEGFVVDGTKPNETNVKGSWIWLGKNAAKPKETLEIRFVQTEKRILIYVTRFYEDRYGKRQGRSYQGSND
jgi:hypothetical protein